MNKTVAILMATYNGEHFLKEQLDSILEQTFTNWILIIHDDGSTDSTVKIIEEYAKKYPDKIVFWDDGITYRDATKNFGHLVEIAREKFQFDYVAFSEQDDVWFPDKLKKSIQKLKELENIHGTDTPLLIYTDLLIVDERLNPISSMWKYQKVNPEKNKLTNLLLGNIVTGCTILMNKKTLEAGAPIPEQFPFHDWWYALVVSAIGVMDFLPYPTAYYRRHGKNVTTLPEHKKRNIREKLYSVVTFKKFPEILEKLKRDGKNFSEFIPLASNLLLERYSPIMDEEKRIFLEEMREFVRKKDLLRRINLIKKYNLRGGDLKYTIWLWIVLTLFV